MMKLEVFLNRVGLENEFSELKQIPMTVFLNGKKQEYLPYPKMNLDKDSLERARKLLSSFKGEEIKYLSVELRMGSQIMNFFVQGKPSCLKEITLFFS